MTLLLTAGIIILGGPITIGAIAMHKANERLTEMGEF